MANTLERIGPFSGRIDPAFDGPELRDALIALPARLETPPEESVLQTGRHLTVRLTIPTAAGPAEVAVKRFGPQPALKDRHDTARGSKALRTYAAAENLIAHGVGTPAPVAILELWEGTRLTDSYYLSRFEPGVVSLKRELIQLFEEHPQCTQLMALIHKVAIAIADMHDAGFLHRDLGNQNILLTPADTLEARRVLFIDLNRGLCVPPGALTPRQRARDISRIYLPSDILRVFREMVWRDAEPPAEFLRWEPRYRRCYALHAGTRKLRHPLRERRKPPSPEGEYPPEPELWLWDENSVQAVSALTSRDRHRYYPRTRLWHLLRGALPRVLAVRRRYRELQPGAFKTPQPMPGRVAVALTARADSWARERALLNDLGARDVLIRIYFHEPEAMQRFATQCALDLDAQGFGVAIALVQSRAAVRDPAAWSAFCHRTLATVAGHVRWVEYGHAVNRVKWGLWGFEEYARFVAPLAGLRQAFPEIPFTGPAAIDFEYEYLPALLRMLPPGVAFEALSHHLYVDRRGAPENRQGPFSCIDKFALARACAAVLPGCGDRLIVSEVNWPLKGTGAYSPVTSPYESPGARHNDPSVSEDDYADYLLRYLLLAACSGFVEQVVVWRLVARGFGLVDDTHPRHWRWRPAFTALQHYFATLGGARFMARLPLPGLADRGWCLRFEQADGTPVSVLWTTGAPATVALPFETTRALDALGAPIAIQEGRVPLTGRPLFLF